MKIAVIEPCLESKKNIIRDVIYGCWCGGKRIGGATVPPYEQLTLATILQNDGHDVIYVDAQAEQLEIDEVKDRMGQRDLVVISTSVMTMRSDGIFVTKLKEGNPDLKIAAYGSHPTFQPEDTLNKGIDFAIQREPEAVIKELARRIEAGDRAKVMECPGVSMKGDDGAIIKNQRMPFMEDLDEIPAINIDFLPIDIDYFNPIVKNLPYITVSSSHGCPAKCSYCTAPFFHGTRTRFMTDEKVLEDIEYYLSKGIREIYYRDETFTADRRRVMAICRGIVDRGYEFSWICNARVDTVDEDMLKAMKGAGCHLIKFGTESGNQTVLDSIKKGITLEQTRQAFRWCNDIGISTHAHFMVGSPGETHETMYDTLDLALEIKPTTATFGICTPYPGTPLFREVLRKDPSIGDGTDNAQMERLHVEGDFNSLYCDVDGSTLRRTVKTFYRRFYLRPTYVLDTIKRMRNMNMLRNAVIGGLNVFTFATDKTAT